MVSCARSMPFFVGFCPGSWPSHVRATRYRCKAKPMTFFVPWKGYGTSDSYGEASHHRVSVSSLRADRRGCRGDHLAGLRFGRRSFRCHQTAQGRARSGRRRAPPDGGGHRGATAPPKHHSFLGPGGHRSRQTIRGHGIARRRKSERQAAFRPGFLHRRGGADPDPDGQRPVRGAQGQRRAQRREAGKCVFGLSSRMSPGQAPGLRYGQGHGWRRAFVDHVRRVVRHPPLYGPRAHPRRGGTSRLGRLFSGHHCVRDVLCA